MRALDVWYDTIDVERFLREMENDETRERVEERLKKVREKYTPDFLFPKFAEHRGAMSMIADDPPLIFHPTAEVAPGVQSRFKEGFDSYRSSLAKHVRTLFDRYHFCDLAMKVVGVGSVGTQCAVALFMASSDDPISLQVKEANASVFEPYVGKSTHPHHGLRVVTGQRLMQSASDLFLGCGRGAGFHVAQLAYVEVAAVGIRYIRNKLRAGLVGCASYSSQSSRERRSRAVLAAAIAFGSPLSEASQALPASRQKWRSRGPGTEGEMRCTRSIRSRRLSITSSASFPWEDASQRVKQGSEICIFRSPT